jgi:hypothetical protein
MKPTKKTPSQMMDKAIKDFGRKASKPMPDKKPPQRIKGWESSSWDSDSK